MPETEILPHTTQVYKRVLRLMGNRFEISVVDDAEETANQHIDAAVEEIRRIEKLLTTFDTTSQTNQINQYAGEHPVKVDQEVFELIKRSKIISQLTQGAFDITYGSVDKRLWNFDQEMKALPDAETAARMVRLINYRNVIMDEKRGTVFLKEAGMRIGFGGIGKGYAAEMARRLLIQRGVKSGVVNAAGDLTVWGYQPNGKPWTIGIADPGSAKHPFSYLDITDMAVATSGNYEKFVVIDGKRYSHTIDPKTGLPVHGIKSVTIMSPNAEIADAMATPVMIMGIHVGLDLVNQVRGLACIIIDENDKIYTSKNINLQ
ncbi:MAG TPA: FAD:protein FMN transferase [Chitinophagaceae bacterium]|nr:FAD:protein FMN transferase [Chitinophagaceae bacterium]